MSIFHLFSSRRERLVLAAALVSASALGAPPGWVALDAGALDAARGGFTLVPSLQLSLGIERMVAINGAMVAQSQMDLIVDAGLSLGTGAPILVQNGAGHLADAALQNGMLIQNTSSGQHIASHTVVHATVNSMALLDAINFQGQLSAALARAAGPH